MRKLVIGLAMASTAIASPALARDNSWYIGGEFGPMLAEDMDLTATDDSAGAPAIGIDYEYGFDGGGYVGYDFGAFRLEAEVSYREADHDTIQLGSVGSFDADGSTNSLAFMLNGMFDFGPDDGLQGYAGGGIGVA
ncbi:MAG: outer membrane beta-barrel protein, partial [Erythrobacter sp.]|nr:outer membrane beta-barrel protein [Erythrobacter sp.]